MPSINQSKVARPAVSDERVFAIESVSDLCRELKSNRAPRGKAKLRNERWDEAKQLQSVVSHLIILSLGNPDSTYNGDYPDTVGKALQDAERKSYELIDDCIEEGLLPFPYKNAMKDPDAVVAKPNTGGYIAPPRKSSVAPITHKKGDPVPEKLKLNSETRADLKAFCDGQISMHELTENLQEEHDCDIVRVRIATLEDKKTGIKIKPDGVIAFDIERTVRHRRGINGNMIATHAVTVIV